MAWDPAQYLKFAGPRLRPALDLLQRIDVEAPGVVYDLGAGAGNVTRLIAARWPEAHVVGVDLSAEMLAKAAAENPDIEWQQADLASWRPSRPADVIYSNAALHWLDNHDRLMADSAERPQAGRRAGGADAAQFRRAVAYLDHRNGARRALAQGARTAAAAVAGGRARRLLRSAGAARRRARHLGDRVSAGAGRRRTRSRNGPRGPGCRRCSRRSTSPSAAASRRTTASGSQLPIRRAATARRCSRSAACS